MRNRILTIGFTLQNHLREKDEHFPAESSISVELCSVGVSVTTFSSKDQALEAVIGGLSRVARAVVAIPVEGRTRSLSPLAESSYRQTARNWGYTEVEIQEWTSTIMSRLRAEVAAQELGEQKNNDDPSLATPSAA